MVIAKVSVSVDAELLAEARELAGRRGLSALINDALRVRLHHARVSRLLDEMDEEFGPIPAAIEEEVRRTWPAAGRSSSLILDSGPDSRFRRGHRLVPR